MEPEQVLEIARKRSRAHGRCKVPTSLGPYHEQGRPGPVLPAEHRGRVERLEVEPTGRGAVRLITIIEWLSVRVQQLVRVREIPFAHKRLRVQLEGEHGRERIIDPPGEGYLFLIQIREVRAGRVRQGLHG